MFWISKKTVIGIPGDEWAHRDALHEWWYVNSHVITASGKSYGIYLFFSDYLIFSFTDKQARKIISKEKITGKRLRTTSSGVYMDGNYMRKKSGSELTYEIHYESELMLLNMTLTSEKQPLIVNKTGLIKEGALGTSWYYSLTKLKVRGNFSIGSSTESIEGMAWIDRQWGSWEDLGIGSWIWHSLQLSNGCEILVTEIYPPFLKRVASKVLSIKMNGLPDRYISDFTIRTLSRWTSPGTGSSYGSKWRIESPGILDLTIKVDFENQELHKGLWQGTSTVAGKFDGGDVSGVGYAEQIEKATSKLSELVSISLAPGHYLMQNLLGRANLGVMDLAERLEPWKFLSASRT